MQDDLIKQSGVCLANSSYLREWFVWQDIPVYLETTLKEVQADKIICQDKNDNLIELECDSVISSVGYYPNPLAPKSGRKVQIIVIAKVGLRTVIWSAYEAAMKL